VLRKPVPYDDLYRAIRAGLESAGNGRTKGNETQC
jgi:hypothetical protein